MKLLRSVGFWIIFVLVILMVGVLIIMFNFDTEKSAQIISGFSTLVLVLLTASYVYTTNRQLSLMQDQLAEMQDSRELYNQPFPWCNITSIEIESPRAYHYGHSGNVSIQCRLHVNYLMKNIGSSLAVNIDLKPVIQLQDESSTDLDCVANKIEYLQVEKEQEVSSLFLDDGNLILKSLVNDTFQDYPVLGVLVVYNNFLGVPFAIGCNYTLAPKSEDRNRLKDWLKALATAQIECLASAKELACTYEKDRVKYEKDWLDFINHFEKSIGPILKEPIILESHLIENSLVIGPADKEKYNELINKFKYAGGLCSRHPLNKP